MKKNTKLNIFGLTMWGIGAVLIVYSIGWIPLLALFFMKWGDNIEGLVKENKDDEQLEDVLRESPNIKKSKFQQRLEEAAKNKMK